jgi:hypothetical protein
VEAPAKTVLLSAVAPAAAIVLAALSQLALTTMWPQVQQGTIHHVSLDSYLVVATALLLSFVVGWSLRQRAPTRLAFWACVLVPAGWLLAWIAALFVSVPQMWLRFDALSAVYLGSAMSPLVGIILGWMIGGSADARRSV